MKRLLAALLGLTIFLLPMAAIAEAGETNPFLFEDDGSDTEEFDIDPFSEFADAFEVDPYISYLDEGDVDADLFAFAFGNDSSSQDNAQDGDAFQSPDVTPTAPPTVSGSGTLEATINGEQLVLNYDPSPAFSNVSNGMAQVAFYTYGDATGNLYELIMVFPVSVSTGDTITPQYAMEHAQEISVMLLISGTDADRYYIASQLNGDAFPSTSSYSFYFDKVIPGETSTQYEGSLSAKMVSYNISSGEIGDSVEIEGANFSLTLSNVSSDKHSDNEGGNDDVNPFLGAPSTAPTSTPPADYRKV